MRCAVAAVLALAPIGRPAAASAQAAEESCPLVPSAGTTRYLAEGRHWHAWKSVAVTSRGPIAAESAMVVLRALEGMANDAAIAELLGRVRGGDSMPELAVLVARHEFRQGRWAQALAAWRRVYSMATADSLRQEALVRQAEAFAASGRADSARRAWSRAAQVSPGVSDWLLLRYAELEPDTVVAFGIMAGMRTPGARSHALALVARRRQEAGNLGGALEVWRQLNLPLEQARVELALGRNQQARRRADSVLFAETLRGPGLLAAQFLDQFRDLTAEELLAMARAHRARGSRGTTEAYLRRAVERFDTSVQARLALARHLAEGGRAAEAIRLVDSAAALAGRRGAARTAAARLEVLGLLGRYDEADTLMDAVSRAHARDTLVARAILFLAERERARGEPVREHAKYRLLVRRFPAAPATLVARFRIGLSLYARGAYDTAAVVLADVARRDSGRWLGVAPRYWDARLRLEGGDTTARDELRAIAVEMPFQYHGVRALELIGEGPATHDSLARSRAGTFAPAAARERLRTLVRLGLREEARSELRGWAADTTVGAQLLIAAASVASEAGFAREAIALGEALRRRVGMHSEAARAIFPYPMRRVIEEEAAEHCVDPLLFAALIRQESRFDPFAVSPAGARGLAQVMPQTGLEVSRRLRIGDFDANHLFVPDFNLHLGTRYLYERLASDNFPLHAAIAAYNAGPARVRRWRTWPEFDDPDLFVERIPIAETRDYVRIVYASYAWYRHLYEPSARSSAQPVPLP